MSRRLRISLQITPLSLRWVFCAAMPIAAHDVDPLQAPDTQLEPITWTDIDGWANDDHAAAFGTFRASCNPFLARRAANDSRPIHRALWEVCRRAASAGALENDKDKARAFFEENFRPVRIAKLGEKTGLLTGYYEPIVDGSRFPNPEFRRRSTAARAIFWSAARKRQRRPCPIARASAVSTPRSKSNPISIAAPSRMARSTVKNSRSRGSRIIGRR